MSLTPESKNKAIEKFSYEPLKYEQEYDVLMIYLLENEKNDIKRLSIKVKNLFLPFFWIFEGSFLDIKEFNSEWGRFKDLEEIYLVLSDQIQEKKIFLRKCDEYIVLEIEGIFMKKSKKFDLILKPEEVKDVNALLSDFGKILCAQRAIIDSLNNKIEKEMAIEKIDEISKEMKNIEEKFNKYELEKISKILNQFSTEQIEKIKSSFETIQNDFQSKISSKIEKSEELIQSQKTLIENMDKKIDKSSNELKTTVEDKITLVKKEALNLIEDQRKIWDQILPLVKCDESSSFHKYLKVQFYPGSQLNITATSFSNSGNPSSIWLPKNCYIKWTLEMKNVYSNTCNFFHRLRLYFTGPSSFYIPDANYGIIHEWLSHTYAQQCNLRETGLFESNNEGNYQVYFQGHSSSGNYMYITDPLLYLEIIPKNESKIIKLVFHNGQSSSNSTSWTNIGNAQSFNVSIKGALIK